MHWNTYRPANDLLQDRVILVTGAGDGLGRCAAVSFARHGATVVLLGRTLKKLEAVYDEIENAGLPKPAIYPMNLEGASPKDYGDLAQVVAGEFGRLDGLLHSAATLGPLSPIANYPVEAWLRVCHVNLTAPFMLTQACLKLLMESPDASVVFTHDRVADEGRAYWGAYGVSKAGGVGLMRMLASELQTNTRVRVNALDPGPAATRLRLQAFPAEDRSLLPTPDSLMPAYLYLIGPDSRGRTGELFHAQRSPEA